MLEEQINSKLEFKERLQSIAEKTTTSLHTTVVPGSGSNSKLEDIVIKISSLEDEIAADISKHLDLLAEIKDTISKVDDPEERLILEYRYLDNMTWEEMMYYLKTYHTTIYRKHRNALEKVEKILENGT